MRLVIETRRQLDEDVSGKLDVLGIAAIAIQSDIAAGIHAERLEIGEAPAAMAAIEIIVGGHAVADRQTRHAGAHGDDLAGDLMTDDARERRRPASGLDVLDRQAGPAGQHARHGLAGTGDRIGQPHQLERRVRPLEQHGFHRDAPCKLQPPRGSKPPAAEFGVPFRWPDYAPACRNYRIGVSGSTENLARPPQPIGRYTALPCPHRASPAVLPRASPQACFGH